MAYSGIGLNAAVQAFPAGYEFGRSLFGQDSASLAQAYKEKAMGVEMALRQRQMEDEAAYRAGQLRNAEAATQVERDRLSLADKIQTGTLKIAADAAPGEIALTYARANSITGENNRENQKLPGQLAYTTSMTGVNNAATGEHEANTTAKQYALGNQKDSDAYADAIPKLVDDPNDPSVDVKYRNRFLTEAGLMSNPNAGKAHDMFMAAKKQYEETGDASLFNDELRSVVGSALAPMIDQNTSAPPGTYRFAGFEPAPGGFHMKLNKVDPSSGQPVSNTPIYLTNGRVPMAEGGVPTVLTPKDVNQILGGLRAAGDWQKIDPELAADMQDIRETHVRGVDPETQMKNLTTRRVARYRAIKDKDKQEQLLQKESKKTRAALETAVMAEVDRLAGFSSKDFVTKDGYGNADGRDTRAIQGVMEARNRVVAELQANLRDLDIDSLLKLDSSYIVNSPALRGLLANYQSAARSHQSAEPYQSPTQGGVVNSSAYSR